MESTFDGLHSALLDTDTLLIILKKYTDLELKPSELVAPLYVCRTFRYAMEKLVYKSISLDEQKDPHLHFYYCLVRNKHTYGLFYRTLLERPDLGSCIQSLSIHVLNADNELVVTQYEIMKRCPSLTTLHLSLHQLYEKDKLRNILTQINPVTLSLRGGTNGPPISPWSIRHVFFLVQNCDKLRHLYISPDEWRDPGLVYMPADFVLPIQTLTTFNDFWDPNEMIYVERISLPNLKRFSGIIMVEDVRSREAFQRCLAEKWGNTLTELDLSAYRTFHTGPNRHYESFDAVIKNLVKLKTLSITAELLSPRSLLSMSNLRHVIYLNADLSCLEVLEKSLRESLYGPEVPLPLLRSFQLRNCTKESGVIALLTSIFSVLRKRGVRRGLYPTKFFAKFMRIFMEADIAMCDISGMYDRESGIV